MLRSCSIVHCYGWLDDEDGGRQTNRTDSVPPRKPRRQYLPLSLSSDDLWKRKLNGIGYHCSAFNCHEMHQPVSYRRCISDQPASDTNGDPFAARSRPSSLVHLCKSRPPPPRAARRTTTICSVMVEPSHERVTTQVQPVHQHRQPYPPEQFFKSTPNLFEAVVQKELAKAISTFNQTKKSSSPEATVLIEFDDQQQRQHSDLPELRIRDKTMHKLQRTTTVSNRPDPGRYRRKTDQILPFDNAGPTPQSSLLVYGTTQSSWELTSSAQSTGGDDQEENCSPTPSVAELRRLFINQK